jgi:hypothetical protein
MSRVIPSFAVIAIVVLTGCSRSVSMRVARDGKDPVFHFQTRGTGMNGVTRLRIWRTDTKEVLWDVSLPYYSERRLRYGEVPTEIQASTGNRASQNFPVRNQKPQPLPSGTSFTVELVYQYDTSFAPSGGAAYFLFSTDASGVPSRVTRLERIAADDLPNPKPTG